MNKNIVIAGPRGRMGSEAVNMVLNEPSFNLVSCIDHKTELNPILAENNIPVYQNPEECFYANDVDVLIDLTVAKASFNHIIMALQNKISCVVGTTGFTNEQLEEIQQVAKENETGIIIAPNFAVGAILMMHFSKIASKYLEDVEIIEKHHDQKVDAPSGTAVKTAEMIKSVRKSKQQGHPDEIEVLSGARGATDDGIHIHSIRLPGLVAHQEVIFGGEGQTLTIKHDSMNRKSFMDGIKLSVNHVVEIDGLIYGLENVLDLD
ncbi:4-hydroxy-tetrahydrodipicolinate reductase [Ornithinibacillus californiensis]|uniref:4-hydroxy-tetrahydrodipicolinate reductase n=1 Tax=Ornithinibacillus californiensis TaxID=161536 RepID=UPI00064DECE0|nr:4-hydroxy-tetrahydrodipicolinate reductase [Ornithinibacillus californiensis]